MEHFEHGHEETQLDLPDPLSGSGFMGLGTWALPGSTLSLASAAVFVIVLAFLLADPERRELFVLPFPAAILAAIGAVLAWAVAFGCRHRPGRHWPRYWGLILAAITTLLTAVSLLPLQVLPTPVLHALIVAGVAAALVLLPRLLKVQPNRRLVQRIAPLTLLAVLLAILPTAHYVGKTVIDHHRRQVDRQIRQLELWTAEVREVTGYDWRLMPDNPELAAANVGRLAVLSFDGVLSDPTSWKAAAALDREADLATASRGLIDAVVEGLEPESRPTLSHLSDPAVRWDTAANRWIPNSRFPGLSQTTSEYHQHLIRLFRQLRVDGAPPDVGPLAELETYSSTRQTEIGAQLSALAGTWADNWVPFQTPGHENVVGQRLPFVDLFKASVAAGGRPPLAAADLGQLMRLPLSDARDLARGDQAPGCRTPEYTERGFEYFRLDCYAYAPKSDGPGAELRVEMRVVYKSAAGTLRGSATPVEVYYLFPLPGGVAEAAFSEEVMTELHAAARELWGGRLRTFDRGGSPMSGFGLVDSAGEIKVYRPREVDFLDDRMAIEIRAEKAG